MTLNPGFHLLDVNFTDKYLVNPGLQVFPGYHPNLQEQATGRLFAGE